MQVSSDVFKKKEKECRKLEAELTREKQKYNELTISNKQQYEDLQMVVWFFLKDYLRIRR